MNTPTVKRMAGAVLAALTLTLVAAIAPASASADEQVDAAKKISMIRDTGWDAP